jgi:succinate dehydrogenase/fumarate reductase flavoprotein subunit
MTVVVVGEGIAGQATAVALRERDLPVTLVTSLSACASESSSRRAGFDAALGEDDDAETHTRDLGDTELLGVCQEARELFLALTRLDVPFAPERVKGLGASRARTAHVGSSTARHVSRRLSRRLRQLGCVRREGWDFVRLVLDDGGHVAGVLILERKSGRTDVIATPSVCLATGGYAGLFDSEHPARGRGAALGAVFRQGAALEVSGSVAFEIGYDAGGIPRALPDVLFAHGASLSSEREKLSWDPDTTRVHDLALRLGDESELDLSGADSSLLSQLAGTSLAAARDLTGIDPYSDPLPVRKVPARSLGGVSVGVGEQSSIPGLYAVGGASARHHRAKTVAGTALLVDLSAARALAEKVRAQHRGDPDELDPELARLAGEKLADRRARAKSAEGESPHRLRTALAELLCGSPQASELEEFRDRLREASCPDADLGFSPTFTLLTELEDALALGHATLLARDEPTTIRCTDDGALERVAPA